MSATGPEGSASEVRLAIIGPSFFSYVQAVAREFERRGIPTIEFDERHSNTPVTKVIYRLGLGRFRPGPKRRHLLGIRDAIRAARCTDVLLISVEVVDRDFIETLEREGMRVHLYLWDGVANKVGMSTLLTRVTNKGTFDPIDSETYSMPYIPLFAEMTFDEAVLKPAGPYTYDIGFCGTVHSSRSAVFARLLRAPWASRLRLNLMLYYQSRAILYIRGIADWNLWTLMPRISTSIFPKPMVAEMMGKTRFTLDIPHPGQSGMTMRTFEVLLAGSRLLTFNRVAAGRLPESLQARVRVIDHIDEVSDIDFEAYDRMPPLSPDERYYISLQRFVDQLLSMMRIALPQRGQEGRIFESAPSQP